MGYQVRNKAERRRFDNLSKEKAKKVMKLWGLTKIDPKNIGRNAAVHCRKCACSMCQGSNRSTNCTTELSIQELKAKESAESEWYDSDG